MGCGIAWFGQRGLDICFQPSFLFGKRVQLNMQRGVLKEGGRREGLRPAHGSQVERKTPGGCNSFAFNSQAHQATERIVHG